MTSSEKIGASIATFLLINAAAHYIAFSGGIAWGTSHMGFALLMANIPAAAILIYIWTFPHD